MFWCVEISGVYDHKTVIENLQKQNLNVDSFFSDEYYFSACGFFP